MKKLIVYPLECLLVLVLGLILTAPRDMFAQSHVVPPSQIQKDLATTSVARQKNREQLDRVFSSAQVRKALHSAHMDSREVTSAIDQLSSSDLAMLAARSANAQREFAAGNMDNHDLLLILVGIAALILIIVAVR